MNEQKVAYKIYGINSYSNSIDITILAFTISSNYKMSYFVNDTFSGYYSYKRFSQLSY